MTNNSKVSRPLKLAPAIHSPSKGSGSFAIVPEGMVTDAGPNHRPLLYQAVVLDLHSSVIIARRFGA